MALNITPPASTSAALAAQITDETGSGSVVFATSPTFVTPVLGTPSSGTLSSCTAATDGTAGVMSAADHTTLTNLSGQASGAAPPFVAVGLMSVAYVTGINLKSNATSDIFTVPASRTFAVVSSYVVPTTVVGGAAVAFNYKIQESGASGAMTSNTAASSAAPVTTRDWSQNGTAAGGNNFICAAASKVQVVITAAWTTSTTVTGTVFVTGFYIT